jgi:class 3 adenylate cyclase/predicted ATPase
MDGRASSGVSLFGEFRLDCACGGLFRCDKRGAIFPVTIGSRALDVLAALIERPGVIVSKEEIMTAVWPTTVVTESNLFVQISALRRALDGRQSGQSCIQTITGRGYRFTTPVTWCAAGMDYGSPPGPQEQLRALSRDAVNPSLPLANPRSLESQPSSVSSAERRQLTVMICDLVGSSALSPRLDPEDLQEVIVAYHRAVAEVVAGFDGFVANYMGAGVLVYFGYPRAHEDDAERAVRAGLGLIDAVGRLDVERIKLQTRVGIATGLVVVGQIGDGSAQEQSVVGETLDLAAGLKALAEPDTVVIAAGTNRLVGDLFEYRDLGAVAMRGNVSSVSAWQVLRSSVVTSRFEALRGSTLSPLVGREEEIDLLLRRWARAKTGAGQVVLVSGEPGLGKSRITAALEEQLHTEPHLRLRYFCSPHNQDSALFPFIDQLGRAAVFAHDDGPAIRLNKLEALLARTTTPGLDVGFLADLLSLPVSKRHPLPNLSPQRKKERILEALIGQLEGLARHQPVVVVFEDAHWIDPTSRELLDLAIERVGSLRVLLIVTFRPEFQPPWTGQAQVSVLTLNRLDRRDRTALAMQIAGGKTLPDEVVAQIVDRTDGVPLFIEELTRSVLESGLLREEVDRYELDQALPPLAIPATLQDSLMARLDRLGSVRYLAQIGAAIGREFSFALLRAVSGLSVDELQTSLPRLVASELVFQRGTPPDAVYSFKHALVQDTAHSSLLRSTRQQLHAQIAEALETHSPETAETQPELLAQHYTEADLAEPAIGYWRRAGERAAKRAANIEAIDHLRRGLALLEALPARAAHAEEELRLLIALGPALMTTMTTSAPEIQQVYGRARQLARDTAKVAQLFATVWGSWFVAHNAGNSAAVLDCTAELFSIAQDQEDPGFLLQAHHCAWVGINAGTMKAAHEHIEAGLPLYSKAAHGHHALLYGGHDPAVCGYTHDAMYLQILGQPDRALVQLDKGLVLARELAHPPSLIQALWLGAEVHFLRRDPVMTLALVAEWLPLVSGRSSTVGITIAMMLRGWSKVMLGECAAGFAELHDGLDRWRATGSRLRAPFRLGWAVAALIRAGEAGEGTAVLGEAFQAMESSGERWYEAELNRHKGQLLLRQEHFEAAEGFYRKALSIAEEQGAKLWELRAAASLARLWRDQGRWAEARDLLAPVYGWFTEGFDTADLKEAKALLDELA